MLGRDVSLTPTAEHGELMRYREPRGELRPRVYRVWVLSYRSQAAEKACKQGMRL